MHASHVAVCVGTAERAACQMYYARWGTWYQGGICVMPEPLTHPKGFPVRSFRLLRNPDAAGMTKTVTFWNFVVKYHRNSFGRTISIGNCPKTESVLRRHRIKSTPRKQEYIEYIIKSKDVATPGSRFIKGLSLLKNPHGTGE